MHLLGVSLYAQHLHTSYLNSQHAHDGASISAYFTNGLRMVYIQIPELSREEERALNSRAASPVLLSVCMIGCLHVSLATVPS